MIDIGSKDVISRTARAQGEILLKRNTLDAIRSGSVKKGDVLGTSKTAAIMAVKITPGLLPLCHNIPIDAVSVDFIIGEEKITCWCEVKARYRTGVEMESLVGVTTALLNVWDMVKYLEKDGEGQYPDTRIGNITVTSKTKGE